MTIDDDFYAISRQNISVLLFFWISYILAYLILTILIIPSQKRLGNYRNRRSNLSRLMLLGHQVSRHSSLPSRYRRDQSLPGSNDNSDSESSSNLSSPSLEASPKTMLNINAAFFSGVELWNSFSLEYVISVFSLSVVIQSVFLIPISMFSINNNENRMWSWLSEDTISQWWDWTWNSALILIFIALPFSIAKLGIIEIKQSHTPLFRKFTLLFARYFSTLFKIDALKGLILFCSLLILYLSCIKLGLISAFQLTEWILFLNLASISGSALLSLICVPLGLSTAQNWVMGLAMRPSSRQDLKIQIEEINRQIIDLQNTFLNYTSASGNSLRQRNKDSNDEKQTTPISSKSIRAKLVELEEYYIKLQKLYRTSWHPIWSNVFAISLLLISILVQIHWFYHQLMNCLWHFGENLLWYFPGVQLIDTLLIRLAKATNLSIDAAILSNDSLGIYSSFWFCIIFQILFSLGLYRLTNRPTQITNLVLVRSKLFDPHFTLEEILRVLLILLVSCSIGTPLLLISGMVDPFVHRKLLLQFVPNSLIQILKPLTLTRLGGFSIFIWIESLFRGLLTFTCAVSCWHSFLDLSRRRHELFKRRKITIRSF